ncbi:MAG: WYL domain-containing protein [Nitrospirota bacterium]
MKWIYQWIPHVEVVEPRELKEEIKRELKEAK